MERRLDAMLRRLEQSLFEISKPQRCATNAFGQGRSILPNAKLKELENLVQRTREIQALIEPNDEVHQEWLNSISAQLKARLDIVMNPHRIFDEIDV